MKPIAPTCAACLLAALLTPRPASAQQVGVGPYECNVQIGPAVGVSDAPGQLHMGFAFGADPSRTASFVWPFEIGVGGGTTRLQMEPGIEGHFRIPGSSLYMVPHAGVGLGVLTSYADRTNVALAMNFGAEARYSFNRTLNLTFQPLRFDVYPFGTAQEDVAPVWFSMLLGASAYF
jgi:hypothetical protein